MNSINTISTQRYHQVHREADERGNGDGKVSKNELKELTSHYARIRNIAYDPVFEEKKEALKVMNNYFITFANNRGQHPNSIRTMEFRHGEDDHIRTNEIDGIAKRDGRNNSISYYDVTGPYPSGYPDPSPPNESPGYPDPAPPSRPRPRPRPPQQQPWGGGLQQQLLMFILRLFMGGQFPRY